MPRESVPPAAVLEAKPYIPHRGTMCLIDTIHHLNRADLSGQVLARLRDDAPYFHRGVFGPHWLIEMAAQAAGAVATASLQLAQVTEPQAAPAPVGYIVHIRNFTTVAPVALHSGDEIQFDVQFAALLEPFGQSHCVVHAHGRVIAEGEMTFLMQK